MIPARPAQWSIGKTPAPQAGKCGSTPHCAWNCNVIEKINAAHLTISYKQVYNPEQYERKEGGQNETI